MDIPRLRETLASLQQQLAEAEAAPAITVAALWARYEEWGGPRPSGAHGARKGWKEAQAPHWRHLEAHFAALPVSAVSLATADGYRDARRRDGCAAATRNHELSSMRACFSWAVKRRLIPLNPLAGMEQEPMRNQRTEFLEEPQFARLLAAAPNPMARVLFLIGYDTGMRRGELRDLRRAVVDVEARLIRLGDGDVKNGDGRMVPLTDRAIEALATLPSWSPWVFSVDGGPIGLSTINDWFRAARDKAGLSPKLVFHSLRHSCATLMRRRGVPWPLVKAALGWKTDVAARRYQQYNANDWSQLRDRMNDGIATETRKGPLKSVPAKAAESSTVTNKAQATIEK